MVSEEEVSAEFAKMADNAKLDMDKVADFFGSNQAKLDDLKFRLKEEKTISLLLEKSKIKDSK